MKYWINVVSRDHVQRGVKGGFTQANHGKPWALRKLQQGDWVVFYSPKTHFEDGEPLQTFTALCQVIDKVPYQVEMTPAFHPWRRKVRFETTHEAPIKPLIPKLSFIEDKVHWGYKFRFGVIEITEHDFLAIKSAMSK
jgi:predicted RNA-binding protein